MCVCVCVRAGDVKTSEIIMSGIKKHKKGIK